MRRPDEAPDPAFSNVDLDRAVTEVVGKISWDPQGIAPTDHNSVTLPAQVGPPIDNADDHNSQGLWEGYGSS